MAGSILIVDDHGRFRASVRRMLEADGWLVVGEAADGASALALVAELSPAVVLLDVGLPDMSGMEVARIMGQTCPDVAVVLVSTREAGDYQQTAVSQGARGFMSKGDLTGAALETLTGV